MGKNTRGRRTVYVTRIPQTSDDSNPLLIAIVCGVSGLALLVLGILRLRKSKKKTTKEGPHA